MISTPAFSTPVFLRSRVFHSRVFSRSDERLVTDGINRRVISGRENTSLILVDDGVKFIDG